MPYQRLSPTLYAADLDKDESTSGALYTFPRGRNAYLQLAPTNAQTIVLDLENISGTPSELRAASASLGVQFRRPIAPSEFFKVPLPVSEDWQFSVPAPVKVSSVSTYTLPSDVQTIDRIESLFQVTSFNPSSFSRAGGIVTNGLTNINKRSPSTVVEAVRFTFLGSDIVIKLAYLSYRASQSLYMLMPGGFIPNTVAVGAEEEYEVQVTGYNEIKPDPRYVPPNALLWNIENTHASR